MNIRVRLGIVVGLAWCGINHFRGRASAYAHLYMSKKKKPRETAVCQAYTKDTALPLPLPK